jgi:PAS domain S-box-containing protein
MDKGLKLFEVDNKSFSFKFMKLFDLLVSEKFTTHAEAMILILLGYLQFISGFYSPNINIFKEGGVGIDILFVTLQDIIRVRNLLVSDKNIFAIAIYLIFVCYVFITFYFVMRMKVVTKRSQYSYNDTIINMFFKYFSFILINPILDISMAVTCFETKIATICVNDPVSYSTDYAGNIIYNNGSKIAGVTIALSILIFLYTIFLAIILALFYNDSTLISNSMFARKNCNYEIYYVLNIIFFSIILNISASTGRIIFIIYNIFYSIFFAKFFYEKYPYYHNGMNLLATGFHVFYMYTSVMSVLFFMGSYSNISVSYILGGILALYMARRIKDYYEDKLLLDTPYHKISNPYHFLFYIKNLLDKINSMGDSAHSRSEIYGIIQVHTAECPVASCPIKNLKEGRYYLCITGEWSDLKLGMGDKIFLLNFIRFVFLYYITTNTLSPDLAINYSYYYLEKIGNVCQAMFNYKKASEAKLSIQELFAYFRLNLVISKSLLGKLKPSNEHCNQVEDLNTAMYYKYEDLSQHFFDEINNDIQLNLEFWKLLKDFRENSTPFEFNKIFSLTNRIRISKSRIEEIWNNLFTTYNGFNYLFDLYEKYVYHVNDDCIISRELDYMKTKLALFIDNNHDNLYNILFSKETGVIILQGEKNKEGLIEQINEIAETIFEYNKDELKGLNINFLMPKMFEKNHRNFMEKYTTLGEKKVIDTSFSSYGKTKGNNVIPIKLRIKIFPILSDSLYFCGLITKEAFDDIILLDHKFNIQGMSQPLMDKFRLNELIFQDFDVPLYLICRKFISHYKEKVPKNKKDNATATATNMTQSNLEFFKLFQREKDVNYFTKKEEKEAQIIQNFEIEENSDMIFEIKVPHLIRTYAPNKMFKNNLEYRFFNNDGSDQQLDEIQEEIDNADEEEDLINGDEDDKYKYDKYSSQYVGKEPDKEFQNKLKYYTQIFEKGSYEILEKEIEKLNFENKENQEYRFNVSLKEFKYSGLSGFVLRCINMSDDLEDYTSHSEVSEKEIIDTISIEREVIDAVNSTAKKTYYNMKNLEEVTDDDKAGFMKQVLNFYEFMKDNLSFYKIYQMYQNDITNNSRIFANKDHKQDQETGSQSGRGFGEDLSKKSKIEEIKGALMKDIESFFTLKWIKGIYYILLLGTFLFSILYIMNFLTLFDNALNANLLNLKISKLTFELGNLISSVFSLKAIVDIKLNLTNHKTYNSFIEDTTQYFNYMKQDSINNYFSLSKNITVVYYDIKKYINVNDTLFVDKVKMNIHNNILYNDVDFNFAIAQGLSHINNLLNNPLFTMEKVNVTETALYDLSYDFNLSIENMYNYIMPYLLNNLLNIDSKLNDFKTSELLIQIYALVIYGVFLILISLLYFFFLYKTNHYMQSELKKICSIRIPQINETIKNLEYFNNKILSKYKANTMGETIIESRIEEAKSDHDDDENKYHEVRTNYQDFSNRKLFKNLTILNKFYLSKFLLLISLFANLILVYFQSDELVTNINSFNYVKNYFFFSLIQSTVGISNIKCTIANCNRERMIGFNTNLTQAQYEIVKDQINFYPEMYDFYTNKYLTNICSYSFNTNNDMNICQETDIIKSANNTQTLLNMVTDYIYYLNKEIDIESKNNPYDSIYYQRMETIFYKFVLTMPDNFIEVSTVSLKSYMQQVYITVLALIIIFTVCIVIFSIVSIFYYISKLIEYISISRCILKIIPTNVIINSYELEEWLGTKY